VSVCQPSEGVDENPRWSLDGETVDCTTVTVTYKYGGDINIRSEVESYPYPVKEGQ